MKVAAIGAGSWGSTVAHICAHSAPTTLHARRSELAEQIRDTHVNSRYLPDFELHPELHATADIEEACDGAEVVVMGVASAGFDATLTALEGHVRPGTPIVSLAKGLDKATGRRMTELICERFPDNPVGALTGPNLAKEILAGHAAASVLAFEDESIAIELQELFAIDIFRVYSNPDLIGCELGGALKNVIAVAAGMGDGLGAGDNTRAMVITRGLAELTRLGVAMGGDPATFMGLAGMGDLVATCISPQSRNRRVGVELGKGKSIEQIMEEMDQVAEGVKSAPIVTRLAEQYGVDMPISVEVQSVVEHGHTAQQAYRGLLRRPQQGELTRH